MTRAIQPFRIDVAEAELRELHSRLSHTRYAVASPGGGGFDPARLTRLVELWRERYDWRRHEARLNGYPQFTASIEDTVVHFVQLRCPHPDATAIVLTHGWPYTFAEMLPLADELRRDFHVVVPSLPGYIFSGVPQGPVTRSTVGETWNTLMTAVLGYERFVTYGEDVGAGVSDYLAATHPESVAGIFATHAAFTPAARRAGESPEETHFFDWFASRWNGAAGYSAIQGTRPDTLAAALSDSPAGLAAWIIEKLEEWSEGEAFTDDDLLTTVMLYWVTNSIGTSFRTYFDRDVIAERPVVTVPAGVAVHTGEHEYPRAMAERNYADLRAFGYLPRGAHFTAFEAPGLLAARLREFVATLS